MWHTTKMFSQFVISSLLISGVTSLYFHIQETEKKCFIEEIPDQTMVTGELLLQFFIIINLKNIHCQVLVK